MSSRNVTKDVRENASQRLVRNKRQNRQANSLEISNPIDAPTRMKNPEGYNNGANNG